MKSSGEGIERVLHSKRLFLVDLDGVLRLGKGSRTRIGIESIFSRIENIGGDFRIVTNSTTETAATISQDLARIGFAVDSKKIITAATTLSVGLRERYGKCECFLIGEDGFREQLLQQGHRILQHPNYASGERMDEVRVVIGLDRRLDYSTTNNAMNLVLCGAQMFPAHRERRFHNEEGIWISVGGFVNALEYATGKKAEPEAGKPSKEFFQRILAECNVPASRTVVIGDNIETDIAGGKSCGLSTVLVLSGESSEGDVISSGVKPDAVVDSIDDVCRHL